MQAKAFMDEIQTHYPNVALYFKDNWLPCAQHWADWGRLDVLDKNCHTNNLVERWFGLLKYDLLGRKTQSSINELVQLLLNKAVPYFIDRRCLQLAGRLPGSHAADSRHRHDVAVQAIVASEGVFRCPASLQSLPPGHTVVTTPGGHSYTAVLGDLSCTCNYSGAWRRHTTGAAMHVYFPWLAHPQTQAFWHAESHVCYHLAAAQQAGGNEQGFSHAMREMAAARLIENGWIEVDRESGICRCQTFARSDR
jgi:hypothetical protein